MKLGGGIATIASILALALTATPAHAALVTVGSPLTGSFTLGAGSGAAPLTFANLSLLEPGSIATSPVNGNVVGWEIIGGPGTTGVAYKLRVLRPVGEGKYLGVGTSAPAKPIGAPAPTNLPIQAEDLVAIDIPAESTLGFTTIAGSKEAHWYPAIADGSPAATVYEEEESLELGYQALVAPQPTITLLGASSGPVSGGTSVAIAGHDFSGATSVKFGSVEASIFPTKSDDLLTAVAPPGAAPGPVDVSVTTPGGKSPAVAADLFTYTAPMSPVSAHCVVPRLIGRKVKAARKALKKANCRLGKVKGKGSKIRAQRPKPGKGLAAGAKINVKLG